MILTRGLWSLRGMHFDGASMVLTALCVQVRVYTKKVGHKPDFSEPVVLTFDRCVKP